ncbi:hypothetical protein [Paraburkholderia caribensis]|uniref:hypothetical protein n=1 Tax=Paraburkholderia caribensis TaxID=75105 RepID=UPI002090C64D|nr:hypothetical protein [Paraburkholderia caribensis]MCO4880229.1 hypothetical protein [Paraburkholderia caribensis]
MAGTQNFSQFTAGTIDDIQVLVGFDPTANSERRYAAPSVVSYVVKNIPVASVTVRGTVKVGSGVSIDSNGALNADVTSVAGKHGDVALSVTDVSGAAKSGANSDITDIQGLTKRPTWKVSGVSATPYDNLNLGAANPNNAGLVQVGNGLNSSGAILNADVLTVAGRKGNVTLGIADVSGVAAKGANSDITSLLALSARPTWNLAGTVATPWDSQNLDPNAIKGRVIAIRAITTSQTYQSTAGTKSVLFKVQGAGGAGGGCSATSSSQVMIAAAGSAGGYTEHYMTSGFDGLPIIIGAGGTPTFSVGGVGGDTTVGGTLLVAKGGGGGTVQGPAANTSPLNANNGANPGIASGGNLLNVTGAVGSASIYVSGPIIAGLGADSPFGTGGVWGGFGNPAPKQGSGYGSGGGAAVNSTSGAAILGGAGAPGVVIVYEYS